jgi:hypothetical protein
MKAQVPAEILINSTRVTNGEFAEIYEFVLNEELRVIECVRVESLAEGIVFAVDDFLRIIICCGYIPFTAEFSGLLPSRFSPQSCTLCTLLRLERSAPTRKIICCGYTFY